MDQIVENTRTVAATCHRERKLSKDESLRMAAKCFEWLKKTSDLQWYWRLLKLLIDARATPEDIGTTKKEIDILMLKTILRYAQRTLDVIEVSVADNSGMVDLFLARLRQAKLFASENSGALIDLTQPSQYSPSAKPANCQVATKIEIIEILEIALETANDCLNAIAASKDIKNLEAFLEHLDRTHQFARNHQQILSREINR